jgi:hypothetical protein
LVETVLTTSANFGVAMRTRGGWLAILHSIRVAPERESPSRADEFEISVPDKRQHRGPHPDDACLFTPETLPLLRSAVSDLSWLLTRGYAPTSALKIVGDRYALRERQRVAVARCACSDAARERRQRSQADLLEIAGRCLFIDGYNVLTSIEAALAGGVILHARDGAYRDIASVHGTWRKVQETVPAAELIGGLLAELGAARAVWHLDRPVSNSGRLKTILEQTAAAHGWPWEIQLVPDPDKILRETDQLVATADSGILDECGRWVNLARVTIDRNVPNAKVMKLSDCAGSPQSVLGGGVITKRQAAPPA